MDGLQGLAMETGISPVTPQSILASVESARHANGLGLARTRLDDVQALIITKPTAGFDSTAVESLRQVVRDAAAGLYGELKFLAIDFANTHASDAPPADGFHALVAEVANLILKAPIVSVACARGPLQGADMELALACSMLIGERGVEFSFAADPIVSVGAYAFLAQKIGFVRAERLMEDGRILSAEDLRDMLLLKDIAEPGEGRQALELFLRRTARRHNSAYGIYRAQRIASPAVDESLAIGNYV